MAVAVKLTNIEKTFPGADKAALAAVSIELEAGSTTLITGANGSGKSLLMHIIAGLESADSGSVEVTGRTGLVFQEADSQILGETPREDIAFGPRNLGLKHSELEQRVNAALAAAGLEDKANYPARTLSGGEKRRLAVAGVLAMDAEIIIFDEPYANLDYPGVVQVNQLLETLHEQHKTIIILTHEIEKCAALAQKIIVLHQGTKIFEGSIAAAFAEPLETWGVRNPLNQRQTNIEDLVWR